MSDERERASERRGCVWWRVQPCRSYAKNVPTTHRSHDRLLLTPPNTTLTPHTSLAISYTTAIFLSLQREAAAACSLIIRPNASLTNLATSSVDRPLTCANGSPKTLVSGTGRGPINGVNGSRVHL